SASSICSRTLARTSIFAGFELGRLLTTDRLGRFLPWIRPPKTPDDGFILPPSAPAHAKAPPGWRSPSPPAACAAPRSALGCAAGAPPDARPAPETAGSPRAIAAAGARSRRIASTLHPGR